MKIITLSFTFWYYPVLMSIFHFLQTFTASGLSMKNLILIPFLNSFSHLFGCIHEDIHILYTKYIDRRYKDQEELTPIISLKQITTSCGFTSVKGYPSKHSLSSSPYLNIYLILLLGFANSFSHSIFFIYTSFHTYGFGTLQSYLSLLFTITLCYFVFQSKLFRHHYLALAIITIAICIYIGFRSAAFSDFVVQNFNNWGLFIGILILYIIPTSFREVIEKYLAMKYLYSSAFILVVESTFSLSLFIFIFIIMQSITCGSDGLLATVCTNLQYDLFISESLQLFNYSSIATLYIWGYVFSTYFANYFRVETIKKLSPAHRFVAEMLLQLYFFVEKCVKNEEGVSIPLEFFLVLFLLFGSCVYNEFIIIRLFDLHINTFMEISKRALNDPLSCAESFDSKITELNLDAIFDVREIHNKGGKIEDERKGVVEIE